MQIQFRISKRLVFVNLTSEDTFTIVVLIIVVKNIATVNSKLVSKSRVPDLDPIGKITKIPFVLTQSWCHLWLFIQTHLELRLKKKLIF